MPKQPVDPDALANRLLERFYQLRFYIGAFGCVAVILLTKPYVFDPPDPTITESQRLLVLSITSCLMVTSIVCLGVLLYEWWCSLYEDEE